MWELVRGLGCTTLSSAMARSLRPGARNRGGCVAGAHERVILMVDLPHAREEEVFSTGHMRQNGGGHA